MSCYECGKPWSHTASCPRASSPSSRPAWPVLHEETQAKINERLLAALARISTRLDVLEQRLLGRER